MNPKSSHNHIGVIEVGEHTVRSMTPMLKHQVDNPHYAVSGDEMELTVYIPRFGSPSAQGL
jgi:hypothetical protein